MGTNKLYKAQAADGPCEIVTYDEADSQSFKEGQFVYLVNGEVTECVSNDTVIKGIAQADATTVRYSDCDVLLANPSQNFKMTSSESSAAALALTDIGVKYAIRVADNRTYIDPSDTDNDAMVIKKVLHDGITAGTLNPLVIASVLPEAFQAGAAAS